MSMSVSGRMDVSLQDHRAAKKIRKEERKAGESNN